MCTNMGTHTGASLRHAAPTRMPRAPHVRCELRPRCTVGTVSTITGGWRRNSTPPAGADDSTRLPTVLGTMLHSLVDSTLGFQYFGVGI